VIVTAGETNGGVLTGIASVPPVRRPVLLATLVTTIAISPVFLVGAQAVQIAPAVGLSIGSLGIVASVFFGSTALSSIGLGRVVQRRGARWGLLATMPTSGLALLGVASCRSVAQLALSLGVAGMANGVAQPSVNALLASEGVRLPLGMSQGIKETAAPAASIAAGLAVPLVALTLGWRWSCVGGAVLSLLVGIAALRVKATARRVDVENRPVGISPSGRRALFVIAVVAGCGSVGGNTIGTFLVDFGVRGVHLAEGVAGIVFAIGGLGTVLGRLGFGWVADRPVARRPLRLTSVAMVIGSFGYLLIATANPANFVIGAVLAGMVGWGWSSLMHFAVVTTFRESIASATGVLIAGFATGSFVGPLVLGQLAEGVGYRLIWIVAAVFNIVGGLLLWFNFRRPIGALAVEAQVA
jgi:MFS family permease